jgi:hypothetical protein
MPRGQEFAPESIVNSGLIDAWVIVRFGLPTSQKVVIADGYDEEEA